MSDESTQGNPKTGCAGLIVGLVLVLGIIGSCSDSSEDGTGSATPSATLTTATAVVPTATKGSPAQTAQGTTSAAVAVVPGLPPEAAEHMELRSAVQRRIEGLDSYYLTLSSGYAWAINGATGDIVPKIMAGKTYNPYGSFFLRSGPYVVYFPKSSGLPDSFNNHVGPRPGMKVIDTDVDLSAQ